MPAATRSDGSFWTWRRGTAIACLLLGACVVVTPVQWYVAYVGVQREKQRRLDERRQRASR